MFPFCHLVPLFLLLLLFLFFWLLFFYDTHLGFLFVSSFLILGVIDLELKKRKELYIYNIVLRVKKNAVEYVTVNRNKHLLSLLYNKEVVCIYCNCVTYCIFIMPGVCLQGGS